MSFVLGAVHELALLAELVDAPFAPCTSRLPVTHARSLGYMFEYDVRHICPKTRGAVLTLRTCVRQR